MTEKMLLVLIEGIMGKQLFKKEKIGRVPPDYSDACAGRRGSRIFLSKTQILSLRPVTSKRKRHFAQGISLTIAP